MKKNRTYGLMDKIGLLKMIKIMRFTIFILFLSLSQTFAVNSYSQQTKLSLDMRNARVEDVLDRIEKNSEFFFMYNKNMVDVDRKVDIQVEEKSVNEVLVKIFANTGITYSIKDRQILLINNRMDGTVNESITQQQKPISGKVTDSSGSPLPGVTVVIKGTTIGTISDADGKFNLNKVPENATLQFTFVGMKGVEVAVGNKTSLNVTLVEETVGIDEVVAIGYGTQKKRDIATAISTVNFSQIEGMPITNVSQALAGMVSGLSVQSTTGAPGDAPILRVRGLGSFSASNDPLVVVDGYPLDNVEDFNQINPADIESVQVLKDASAAAIYGSRGGNGVIMVTTKRGKEGKVNFSASANIGVSSVLKKIDLMNGAEFVEYSKEAYVARGKAYPTVYDDPTKWVNTDWQDVIFRTASTKNYQISASGGSEKTKYLVSASYANQEGIVVGTDYERFTVRVNLDTKFSKKFKFSIDLAPSYTYRNTRPSTGDQWQGSGYYSGIPNFTVGNNGTVYTAMMLPPIMAVKLENGDYNQPKTDPYLAGFGLISAFYNPLGILEQFDDYAESMNIRGSATMTYEIIDGLSFQSRFSGDAGNNRRNLFVPSYIATAWASSASYSKPDLNGIRSAQRSWQNYNWVWDQTLTYNKSIGKHNLGLTTVYSAENRSAEECAVYNNTGAYTTDALHYIGTSTDIRGSASKSKNTLISYIGRVNYNFDNKYFASATIRRDGSSRFGLNNRYATFPSASLAWRASEESFLKENPVISELKIRADYGVTGNNSIGNYASVAKLSADNYPLGTVIGLVNYGYSPSGYSNPDLTWETNTQKDIGVDIGLFDGRINLTADVYERFTTDMLYSTPVSALAGFSSTFLRNVGNVRNKGFEFELVTHNLSGKLKWTTNANLSLNRNKIVKYYKAGADYNESVFGWNTTYIVREGGSLGDIYGYIVDGVYMSQSEVDAGPVFKGSKPGDLRIVDVNGDGVLDTNDQGIIGNVLPNFMYGLTNTFSYGGFNLRILLQGVQGGKIIDGLGRNTEGLMDGTQNASTRLLNRWKSEVEPGDGKIPRVNNGGIGREFSSRFVHDGSYLSIKNITLSYLLPKHITDKLNMKSVSFNIAVQNVYTFTNYYGYNPEVNIEGGSSKRFNLDQGNYPVSRTISIGTNINF